MNINERLAVEVMGWEKETTWFEGNRYIDYWTLGNGIPIIDNNIGKSGCLLWHPDTSLDQAKDCMVEYIKQHPERRFEIDVEMNEDGNIIYGIDLVDVPLWMKGEKYPYKSRAEGADFSLAICEAIEEVLDGHN